MRGSNPEWYVATLSFKSEILFWTTTVTDILKTIHNTETIIPKPFWEQVYSMKRLTAQSIL